MAYEKEQLSPEEEISRIKRPDQGELYALVTTMLGAGKMMVDCSDGKTRLARIPGKMKKRIWIRIGDIILVKPWDIEPEKKCDVSWRYSPTQASWIKRKGIIKNIDF